eukprot:TRINITY_DN40060_c0_g1_i1.p1 TRINITY_DN40060_c0_g1~~TRINITY_DN40060_c0_g1_i1.p1  ORF type:complete len:625 (+),score=140.50 TRINITY_DN40060_c0_g1_i1:271-1875(+)
MFSSSFRNQRLEQLQRFLNAAVAEFPTLEDCPPLARFLDVSAAPAISSSVNGEFGDGRQEIEVAAVAPDPANDEGEPVVDGERRQPSTAMDELRELRRRRWLQQAPAPAASDGSSAGAEGAGTETSPSSSSRSPAPAPSPTSPLQRAHLLPLRRTSLDDAAEPEASRLGVLRDELRSHVERGAVLTPGAVVRGADGRSFAVVKCDPECGGIVGASTRFFAAGPALPRLTRVQFTALPARGSRVRESALVSEYLAPHFRGVFGDAARAAVVGLDCTERYSGLLFHVSAVEPSDAAWGVVDEETRVYANLDAVEEFRRLHVVPFSDTLPSAYQFDLFTDYLRPYLMSHKASHFVLGQSFVTNGVHFKIVAAEPRGPCRVGDATELFHEGTLHPTATNLLSPEQARSLAIFPPGLQLLLLQSDMFGTGDVGERIMAAQESRALARTRDAAAAAVRQAAEERSWAEILREGVEDQDQQCVVCLCDFAPDDRVRRLPCRHVFHCACIDEWLGRDAHCPLCRSGLRPPRRTAQRRPRSQR